jgi:hypothetical protein
MSSMLAVPASISESQFAHMHQDQLRIVGRRCVPDMLPNRFDNDDLDLCRRHA